MSVSFEITECLASNGSLRIMYIRFTHYLGSASMLRATAVPGICILNIIIYTVCSERIYIQMINTRVYCILLFAYFFQSRNSTGCLIY